MRRSPLPIRFFLVLRNPQQRSLDIRQLRSGHARDAATAGFLFDARKHAAMTQGAPPDEYYPAGAKRREEQGEIVVRAHVTAAGCASEFAVVVSSGYPDLDQGAVQLAEASRYAAAKDGDKAADGYVTFKVRFEITP